jgi:colanic acid biosynthesis glycosyl transferase WcaI
MKITIFTQYYDPQPCSAAKRTTATARKFASSGFAVDIVTGFPDVPGGTIAQAHRGKVFSLDRDGGIHVARVWTFASAHRRGPLRMLSWVAAALGAAVLAVARIRSGDAIYVSIPPIALAIPALIASYVSRAPLFIDARDAYPHAADLLESTREKSLVAWIVAAVAALAYRRARAIFCATQGVKEAIASRCGPDTAVHVVTDGVDRTRPAAVAPFERTNGEFVVAYAGGMDVISGLDVVLDAAAQLRDERDIRFVLVGGGSEAARLRDRVRDEALTNVQFVGIVPSPVALAALRDADAAIVPLKRQLVDCLPGKLFDALGVAAPVLLSGAGEARRLVERAGAGWCAEAEDPAQLAAIVRTAASDRAACKARGVRGRDYASAHYDRDRILSSVVRSVFAATSPLPHRPCGDAA